MATAIYWFQRLFECFRGTGERVGGTLLRGCGVVFWFDRS